MYVDFLDGSGGVGSLGHDHIHFISTSCSSFSGSGFHYQLEFCYANWEHFRLFLEPLVADCYFVPCVISLPND